MVGYSLWLLPQADDEAVVTPVMRTLAGLFGHPPFDPHLTVQGNLGGDPLHLASLAAQTAAQTPVLEWKPPVFGRASFFYRAFFLQFDDHPTFDALGRRVGSQTKATEGRPPYPHLSLAYGEADRAPGSVDLVEVLEAAHPGFLDDLTSRCFRFDRLAVALSAQGVPLDQWRLLETFQLGSG